MFRLVGNMLGTADIIAQMADRCYLEKCRDRLYPEFVEGGLASSGPTDNRAPTALFSSPADLLCKTPGFYRTATTRLTEQLGATYDYLANHFRGQNLYLDEVNKNIRYAERISAKGDLALLRRVPPPGPFDATATLTYRELPQLTPDQPTRTPRRR
jgi:hypothetical protein